MSWLGWLVALFIAYWFLSDLLRSKRCRSHGVFGRCRRCEEEAAARVKAEAKARAEAERQRTEILITKNANSCPNSYLYHVPIAYPGITRLISPFDEHSICG